MFEKSTQESPLRTPVTRRLADEDIQAARTFLCARTQLPRPPAFTDAISIHPDRLWNPFEWRPLSYTSTPESRFQGDHNKVRHTKCRIANQCQTGRTIKHTVVVMPSAGDVAFHCRIKPETFRRTAGITGGSAANRHYPIGLRTWRSSDGIQLNPSWGFAQKLQQDVTNSTAGGMCRRRTGQRGTMNCQRHTGGKPIPKKTPTESTPQSYDV